MVFACEMFVIIESLYRNCVIPKEYNILLLIKNRESQWPNRLRRQNFEIKLEYLRFNTQSRLESLYQYSSFCTVLSPLYALRIKSQTTGIGQSKENN